MGTAQRWENRVKLCQPLWLLRLAFCFCIVSAQVVARLACIIVFFAAIGFNIGLLRLLCLGNVTY